MRQACCAVACILRGFAAPPLQVKGITDAGLKPRKVKKVAVLGGGLMGSGIATASALAGMDVLIKEVNDKFLQVGRCPGAPAESAAPPQHWLRRMRQRDAPTPAAAVVSPAWWQNEGIPARPPFDRWPWEALNGARQGAGLDGCVLWLCSRGSGV